MNPFRRWQIYVWVASGAGWSVLAYVTNETGAGIAAVLCIMMAALWNELVD